MDTPLIEFKDVTKRFGKKVVLDKVSFSVLSNETTVIIGKSGVGKSVTLKLIIGLLRPDGGDIFYQGKPYSKLSRKEKKEITANMNFMFQNNALFDSMTIYENIALPLVENTHLSSDAIKKKVLDMMKLLDLEGTENKYPSQLSGGMQKRVALARALITDPKVVLFDEPTTGLDPIRKNSVLELITHNQVHFNFTAVLVSHDVPDVLYIANRVILIDEGKVVFEGVPEELEHFQHPVAEEFLNSQEKLKDEVIGLLTKKEIETWYRNKKDSLKNYILVVFTINNMERIRENVGNLAAYRILSVIAGFINKYPKKVVSSAYTMDRIVSIFSTNDELEIDEFLNSAKHEIDRIRSVQRYMRVETCVDFEVMVGKEIVDPERPLLYLVQRAHEKSKLFVRLVCERKSVERDL